MKLSAIKALDGYKTGHVYQYPCGTQYVYSNMTARSGNHSNTKTDGVIFFGLQGFIKSFLIESFGETFFKAPLYKVLNDYQRRMDNYLGKDMVTTEHIEQLHNLGYLPLVIKALPEGSFVPYGVPLFTIVNTRPQFFWLTNMLETIISCEMWRTTNSATMSLSYRKKFIEYAIKTGSPIDFVNWQGHDFSFRGMGGLGDAASSGAAHLTSFYGTDTIPAIDYLEEYYGADSDKEIVGGSVPATEHSVICMGTDGNELETFDRLITKVYPEGIVSIVSDTWDFWKVLTEYMPALKDKIMSRKGRVVIRPDSGNPVDIICGEEPSVAGKMFNTLSQYQEYLAECGCFYNFDFKFKGELYHVNEEGAIIKATEYQKAKYVGAYELLWNTFGGTINEKGYKVLDPHVGLIYGDSITLERQEEILRLLEEKGFCASNLVLGIGSYTYAYNTRDTHGIAIKSTWGVVKGEERELFKDPVTDDGVKKSAKGLLRVDMIDGKYVLKDQCTHEEEEGGCLETVFCDGVLVKEVTLSEIRERILLH